MTKHNITIKMPDMNPPNSGMTCNCSSFQYGILMTERANKRPIKGNTSMLQIRVMMLVPKRTTTVIPTIKMMLKSQRGSS
jgi:hypothetical protein